MNTVKKQKGGTQVDLKSKIRSIVDYPEKGIIFRDITTLLQDGQGLHEAIDQMEANIKDIAFDVVVGVEARGFLFAMPIAYNLGKGCVLVRKKGKLPADVISKKYALEYGSAVLEMHKDAIEPGQRVIIVDDLLATGGTTRAMIELVEQLGGKVVGLNFLIELDALQGREELAGYDAYSVIRY